ncbi:MAG TPA: prephenate dehydrogenase/arogenate dehydrogenase family protein [Aggregatilineales bacterium]|nr:prephenate dehydrogenase/arogenate dehydrogenase family protein [Aggregatilineales bacterium]
MAKVEVALIGLDRRTVSLGLALKAHAAKADARHSFTITGYDEDPFAVETAEKLGALDQVVSDPALAVRDANLVYVAVPYHALKTIFREIGPTCKRGGVVVDLAPLKEPSIGWAKETFKRDTDGLYEVYLVGASVIANSELLGDPRTTADAASAELFENATLALGPAPDCPPDAVALVSDLSTLLNIKLRFMDPAEHDGAIAAMEALPLLLQLAMFESVKASPGWEDLQHLANSPFALGTFRLGLDDPKDAAQMLSLNRANNVRVLENLIAQAGEILEVLRTGDGDTLEVAFEHATEDYATWEQTRRASKMSLREQHQLTSPGLRLFGSLPGLIRGKKGS